MTGTAILLAVTFCVILWIRRTKARDGDGNNEKTEKRSTATPEEAATARQLSAHMRRFLSIVEQELDAGDAEPDNDAATAADESRDEELPSTAIVALELPTWTETTDNEAADKDKDAEGDDGDCDEDGSRLVVIDNTRLVPEIDVETFTG